MKRMLKNLMRGGTPKTITVGQYLTATQKWEAAKANAKAAEGRYRALVTATANALQAAKAAHDAESIAWGNLVDERDAHRQEMMGG